MNVNLNGLRDQAYKTACEHGFHDEELSNEHLLMLVITELAEAVEADRKGKVAQRMMFEMNCDTPHEDPTHHWCFCFDQFIKDSVPDELADAVIRLLDLAGLRGIDIDFSKKWIEELCDACEDESFTESIYAICNIHSKHTLLYSQTINSTVKYMIASIWGLAEYLNIDIAWHIEQKMKYNELREKMHGKKY